MVANEIVDEGGEQECLTTWEVFSILYKRRLMFDG